MSFRFEPTIENPRWDRERYEKFLNLLAKTHPNVEEMTRRAVQLATSKSGKPPQVKQLLEEVLAVRAISDDGLHVIQMMPDQLTVNYVRGDAESYPGFTKLLDDALDHCRKYIECYRSMGILESALHYVDSVEVPLRENRVVSTDEYFTIKFEAPETTFGGFVALEVKAVMLPPASQEPVVLIFSTDPVSKDQQHRTFHMEWHTAARNGSRMEEADLRANLQAAHVRLENCFRSAFTSKGWALFEPDDEP